jgi:hypothetical protein
MEAEQRVRGARAAAAAAAVAAVNGRRAAKVEVVEGEEGGTERGETERQRGRAEVRWRAREGQLPTEGVSGCDDTLGSAAI